MKKYWWIALILVICIIGGVAFFIYKNNSNNTPNYSAEKTDFNTTLNNTSNNTSNTTLTHTLDNITNTPKTSSITEKEISSFTTKIQNKKDSNRQGNISITCSALTNTIVEPGKTFSFCDVVGESTSEKGYKEANVIIQGVETKGLGGGNCQVSSTLYNAVLAAPELEVVERHPHSAPVPYIEEGKDAAISYGSHDFKFKNNSDSQVKVIAENTPDNITIKLIKLIKE
jgi:vancomycin resistance protein YoaR